jgi:cytochrome c-type biogenesis protein CcmH/NrfG
LRRAVKENKTDDEAWYYLGLVLLAQRIRMQDATKAFETAIKLRPQFAAAHSGLAYALFLRNKSPEAFREAKRTQALIH